MLIKTLQMLYNWRCKILVLWYANATSHLNNKLFYKLNCDVANFIEMSKTFGQGNDWTGNQSTY